MYSDLNSVFNWSETKLPSERLIVIEDSIRSDGSFLLHHFLNMFLKAEQRVCLVGFEQTLTHYFLVARKLGVNLQAAGSKGNFSFMNGLTSPYDWTDHVTELETPTNIATTQSLSQASVFSFNSTGSDANPTKKLFDNVKKWMDRQPTEGSVCLIIDNINYLLNACDNMLQVLDFIQYCTALIEARTAPSCVVILSHSDAESDEKFIQSLRYRADLIMKVDGFASGYSKDIDGELTFVQKSTSNVRANHGVNSLPHLQFKLLESTVKFNTITLVNKVNELQVREEMENIQVIDVAGIHTEVYARVPPKYNPLKIVIVPGNPGIVDFYVDFVDLLFEKFGQKHSVLIAGHAGQGAPGKNESKLFSLQEQTQHKYDWMQLLHDNKEYELLSATCEGEKTTPSFIVMGHSIGGYITLKILKNTKGKFDVKQAVLLMPTFRNLYDGLAPLIKVAIRPGFRQTLSTIAHYAPTALMIRLAKNVLDSEVSKPVINILQQKANYHVVLNCLYMAYCEAQEVIAVDDDCKACFEQDLDKILFLYSQIDKYTPLHFVDDLRQDYPKANVMLAEKKVTHAFVVGYSQQVVEQISPQLKL